MGEGQGGGEYSGISAAIGIPLAPSHQGRGITCKLFYLSKVDDQIH